MPSRTYADSHRGAQKGDAKYHSARSPQRHHPSHQVFVKPSGAAKPYDPVRYNSPVLTRAHGNERGVKQRDIHSSSSGSKSKRLQYSRVGRFGRGQPSTSASPQRRKGYTQIHSGAPFLMSSPKQDDVKRNFSSPSCSLGDGYGHGHTKFPQVLSPSHR